MKRRREKKKDESKGNEASFCVVVVLGGASFYILALFSFFLRVLWFCDSWAGKVERMKNDCLGHFKGHIYYTSRL
jgi:hypothetical protein